MAAMETRSVSSLRSRGQESETAYIGFTMMESMPERKDDYMDVSTT